MIYLAFAHEAFVAGNGTESLRHVALPDRPGLRLAPLPMWLLGDVPCHRGPGCLWWAWASSRAPGTVQANVTFGVWSAMWIQVGLVPK